jgi:3D (Asp-Asp-Asp) domain-containing protein
MNNYPGKRFVRKVRRHNSLLSIKEFSNKHTSFSESALWGLRFKSKPRNSTSGKVLGNALDSAFIKLGSRVYIDEYKFFFLIRQGGEDTNSTYKVHERKSL